MNYDPTNWHARVILVAVFSLAFMSVTIAITSVLCAHFGEILRMIRWRMGMPELLARDQYKEVEVEPEEWPVCQECGTKLRKIVVDFMGCSISARPPEDARWYCPNAGHAFPRYYMNRKIRVAVKPEPIDRDAWSARHGVTWHGGSLQWPNCDH